MVKIGNWSGATDSRTQTVNLLQSMSGLATVYDFTQKKPYQTSIPNEFLNKDEVKKALGVNESMVIHDCSKDVGRAALHEKCDEERSVHGGILGEEEKGNVVSRVL